MMQEIFTGDQVKILDSEYLKSSGLESHQLMERAAGAFVSWFLPNHYDLDQIVYVAVGKGNNGGDGIAIARLLAGENFKIKLVRFFDTDEELSRDATINFDLLPEEVEVFDWNGFHFSEAGILIDAYLGVGVQGNLRKDAKEKIRFLNGFPGKIISVDMPSGLPSDQYQAVDAVKATITVTFQFPKLSLLVPDYAAYCGELVVLDIGIVTIPNSKLTSEKFYLQEKDLPSLHRKFSRFSYKNDFGKVLIIGGSLGMMGALHLSCKSALRTGSGLVTCHLEESERGIIQESIPEVMCTWGSLPDLDQFDSVAVGPGWGTDTRMPLFEQVLKSIKKPMVLDADALYLLAAKPSLVKLVPANSILTPHIGEFRRLVGEAENHFERIKMAKDFSKKHNLILVLKGANSVISLPDGQQIFNCSGTQFMGTGGAGDVLTGMIVAFLGMGYSSENAAFCGVYHHGLAGEIAAKTKRRGLIASDIIEAIPETYLQLNIT
jgi:NAD(P)H-hydrate epimerase